MGARVDLGDQVALPGQALDLPGAQAQQAQEQGERDQAQDDQGVALRDFGGIAGGIFTAAINF